MKGIDCATPITQEIAAALASEGVLYIGRYIVPSNYSKSLSKEESEIICNLGMKLISIFELDADDYTKSGAELGNLAYIYAKNVGQPEGTPIFFTVDSDTRDYDTIETFLKEVKENIPGYFLGLYGAYNVVEEMHNRGAADYFWQTYAWSNGQLSDNARDIYQYENDIELCGIRVDMNDVYFDNVSWQYPTAWENTVEQIHDYEVKYNSLVSDLKELIEKYKEV